MEWVVNAARYLERGRGHEPSANPPSLWEATIDGPLGRGAERIWESASASRVKRPLRLPPGLRTIAVGGATLGGSGKTPLALLCAEIAARHGAKTAIIGHAFRASPRRARIVCPDDAVGCVGDEALVCARRAPAGVLVVVAPSRQSAVDHAASCGAEVLILDGVAQSWPRRADLALLALQAPSVWGAGACPPRGDLRAPKRALLDACDRTVRMGDELEADLACDVVMSSRGGWSGARCIPYGDLSGLRVGLVTSLARPARLTGWLGRRGVVPEVVLSGADHRPVAARALRDAGRRLDVWVASEKCATHLAGFTGPPVLSLDYRAIAAAGFERGVVAVLTAPTGGHRLEIDEFLPCALGTEPRPWGP